jgi:hypothetical protein
MVMCSVTEFARVLQSRDEEKGELKWLYSFPVFLVGKPGRCFASVAA